MRLLTHTNIVIDDFEFCKDYKPFTFIHFLTHFHQDHWKGLTPLWNYGIIFCTEITRKLILNKFSKIINIVALEVNKKYKLNLLTQCLVEDDDEFTIEVQAFDANHIPGSVMYLFKGAMGTLLHTGDFRFTKSMLDNFTIGGNKIQIDEMIFDNTYCDPMFDFPTANEVAKDMISIIKKNKHKKVFIAMGALGYLTQYKSKEAICSQISKHFQVPLLVDESKYTQLQIMGSNLNNFTVNPKDTFISIIKKSKREIILEQNKDQDIICITTDFLMLKHRDPDGINYMVPYSLHSNYKEMQTLIEFLKPAILRVSINIYAQKLVIPYENFAQYRRTVRINPFQGFQSYLKRLKSNGESGYSQLIRNHTDFTKISKEYLQWMNPEKSCLIFIQQESLLLKLGIQLEPDRAFRKRKPEKLGLLTKKQQIEELESQFVFGARPEKKLGLDHIAEQLKATNNNQNIVQYLKKPDSPKPDDEEMRQLFQKFILKQD